jgi:predicted secreted hydrolase
LALLAGLIVTPKAGAQVAVRPPPATPFAAVVPGYTPGFPRDEGSHPEFRTEWWYVTGWLENNPRPCGFQITFFRMRPELRGDNPSAFTPRHVLIAHAAISDTAHGGLQRDQRVAREGFALAGAAQSRVDLWIDDWSLKQENSVYRARIPARDFQFDLAFSATQPPLLQGINGLSRKGPHPASASYYYSMPQLKVQGTLTRGGKAESVGGTAWLDHEWSSSYMDKEAVGWDWIGINLADGGALMAFRMRDKLGRKFWSGGAYRAADGTLRIFESAELGFAPLRVWRSPRTDAVYPIAWRISAGNLNIDIVPLMDDQENDTRATTGTIYWEGAVRAFHDGTPVGRGYLELTGYWRGLRL